MKTVTKLWVGLGILVLFSPLGLLLPEYFKATEAWGEWGADQLKELVGYLPIGLERISTVWSAPIPDYAFVGQTEKGLLALSFEYIFSAALGIFVVTGLTLLIAKSLANKSRQTR